MKIAVLGIDLGKNVCSVVGLDVSGAVVLRRRVRRDTLIDLVAKLPACIVGMEACCGKQRRHTSRSEARGGSPPAPRQAKPHLSRASRVARSAAAGR